MIWGGWLSEVSTRSWESWIVEATVFAQCVSDVCVMREVRTHAPIMCLEASMILLT